jgi:hypothetical protein
VPPHVLTSPPAAYDELTAYAYRGSWTSSAHGFIRGLGTLWLIVIALPVIFALRMVEWIIQRPSRALFFVLVWELAIRTPPGLWLCHDVLRPFWSVLGWIFLS